MLQGEAILNLSIFFGVCLLGSVVFQSQEDHQEELKNLFRNKCYTHVVAFKEKEQKIDRRRRRCFLLFFISRRAMDGQFTLPVFGQRGGIGAD